MTAPLDVLIVGAGPGGLAAAIRLHQLLAEAGSDASVAVIDKAPRPGYHCLSGAAFEAECLDELIPGWRDDRRFMEHVLPRGFVKIRHYGLLANRHRAEKLERCHRLLLPRAAAGGLDRTEPARMVELTVDPASLPHCPQCGGCRVLRTVLLPNFAPCAEDSS